MSRFDDPFLDGVAAAFGHRAKAIRYRANRVACTREIDEEMERLDIDIESVWKTPFRTIIWQDRVVWLGIHHPGPRRNGGWLFDYRAHGTLGDIEPTIVVAQIERTFERTRSRIRGFADAPQAIEEIWRSASLERER